MSTNPSKASTDSALQAAIALHRQGDLRGAEKAYAELAARFPANLELVHARGVLALQLGQSEKAIELLSRAEKGAPANVRYRANLGLAFKESGRFEDALARLEALLTEGVAPPEALSNLGELYRDCGRFEEAARVLEEAAKVANVFSPSSSNWLFGMLYDDTCAPATIHQAHCNWGARVMAAPQAGFSFTAWNWDASRPLRVGFVSSDFREHPVADFLRSFLRQIDRSDQNLVAFSSSVHRDGATDELGSMFDEWHDIAGRSDLEVARQIHASKIDILIDLNGHTAGNRLQVFAQKPAPLQVSYLGYPHATGLPAMDFRITDPWADPIGEERRGDRVLRLPECAWCFSPSISVMEDRPPVVAAGPVVFGYFGQLGKVSPTTVKIWSQVLRLLPDAKLAIKSRVLSDPVARYELASRFLLEKIDPSRLAVQPWQATRREHLASYHAVDIALDAYPYNGTTTTCEALSMGVPVVTLAGSAHVSRVGASLVRAAGFPEGVTHTAEEFIERAVRLGAAPQTRRARKAEFARMVQTSPLANSDRFARDFRQTLRAAWIDACLRRNENDCR